jgi:hypothetical protein
VQTAPRLAAAAKAAVADLDVRRSWVFFGDPAMRLKDVATEIPPPPPPPTLSATPTALNFGVVTSGGTWTAVTSGQTVRLTQSGAGTVTWTASADQPWIQITGGSGTGTGQFTVSLAASGLACRGCGKRDGDGRHGRRAELADCRARRCHGAWELESPVRHGRHAATRRDGHQRIDSGHGLGARRRPGVEGVDLPQRRQSRASRIDCRARKGYEDDAPSDVLPLLGGMRQIVASELDRIEIQLPAGGRYAGYLMIADERRPLPIGSTLDRSSRRFYWQPGPGFIGKYTLVFVHGGNRRPEQVTVEVVLEPRYRNASDIQMAIDLPRPGDVPGSFLVAGWAIDRGAAVGTGIDTLHVWAYPNPGSGNPPIFLGPVRLGGFRPDPMGAPTTVNGFGYSAYHLAVTGLPPGSYDLAVFPHSTVTGQFEAAAVVRIRIP